MELTTLPAEPTTHFAAPEVMIDAMAKPEAPESPTDRSDVMLRSRIPGISSEAGQSVPRLSLEYRGWRQAPAGLRTGHFSENKRTESHYASADKGFCIVVNIIYGVPLP